MKVAVTYENGMVFQHFGHSEAFKIYTVEDEKVVSSEVVDTNGSGHEALASFLAERNVGVLICGGIGGGAMSALTEAGIEVYSGVSGEADEAVEVYLNGELLSQGENCDHHDHEEGHDCHCGGGCGSCGGGCGSMAPLFEGPNVGKTCKVHYKGTFNDGTQFDSSYDRGEPLEFTCGIGMMIRGFDKAVATMNVGDVIDIHLEPSEAYGELDPTAIVTLPIKDIPGADGLVKGDMVYLQNALGQPIPAKVAAVTETDITFDANHEMAGKELNFRIELVEVEE